MKKLLFFTATLFLGALIGWYVNYYQFYSYVKDDQTVDKQLEMFFDHSNENISNENFRCENETQRNVGKLFMGMVSDSMAHKSKTLSASCDEKICTISYSYCKPWQTSECGARVLFYKKMQNGEILSGSFECLDLP